MKETITLNVISLPNGATAYFLPRDRTEVVVRRLNHLASLAKTDKEKKPFLDEAQELQSFIDRLESHPGITQRSFDIKKYSLGEKRIAQMAATQWVEGVARFDEVEYSIRIVAVALGITKEEVEAMEPNLFPVLYKEILSLCEPDPVALDFFVMSPTSLEGTKTKH